MTGSGLTRFIFYCCILVTIVTGISGCDDNECTDPGRCRSYPPDSGNLRVKVTINRTHKKVPLTFYKGKLNDSIIAGQDTARTSIHDVLVPTSHSLYTVTAKYKRDGNTIIAVDNDQVHYDEQNCDKECYVPDNGKVDLELVSK